MSREKRKFTPPRYDEVYFEGVAWLDGLSEPPGDEPRPETKQVIVLRTDLGMRKGKMVAQGAHASMKVFFDRASVGDSGLMFTGMTQAMEDWFNGSFTKITVGVSSEEELLAVYERAREAGVICSLIQDSGRTEFHGVPTHTAVAVGPDYLDRINLITGELKLL